MGGGKSRGRLRRTPLVAAALGLAACGGGEEEGSSYLSPFAPPAPVAISVLEAAFALPATVVADTSALLQTVKYVGQQTPSWGITLDSGEVLTGLISNPLMSSGAAFAHAAGLTGSGQVIAVSDDQYLPDYAEFDGSNVEIMNNWDYLDPGASPPTAHGTIVSAVALGESDDFIGIAPGAQLLFGSYETDAKLAELGRRALAAGAVAWNNSWGYPSLFLNQDDFDLAFDTFPGSADYLQSLRDFSASGVVVFAASNDDTLRHSTLMEGLPYLLPELEAGWIAAVNGVPTFSGGDVASVQLLSSACNEAARWCLIADGAWQIPDLSLRLPGSHTLVTGSSFAAPQVSGALALLAEAFPQLDPHQLRVRLLASADDGFFSPDASVELAEGFDKGYSFTYGHGFLDIEAALRPIGTPVVTQADGTTLAVSEAAFSTGAAFGDVVQRSLAGVDLAVSDSLAASFKMPGAALAAAAAPAPLGDGLLRRAMASNLAATRTAAVTAPRPAFADHAGRTLDVVDPSTGLRAALLLPGEGSAAGQYGLALTQPLGTGPVQVDLGLKVAQDDGDLLGFGGGEGGAGLASVGLTVSRSFDGGGFLALQAEMGIAEVGVPEALSAVSAVGFDSYGLEVGRRGVFTRGDRLSLGVSMPTAATSGSGRMDLAIATADGGRAVRSVGIALAPSERQVDLAIGYQMPVGERSELMVELVHAENWGNVAGREETAGVLGFTFRF